MDVYDLLPGMNTTLGYYWLCVLVVIGGVWYRTCGTRSMIRKQVVIMGRVIAAAGGVVDGGCTEGGRRE